MRNETHQSKWAWENSSTLTTDMSEKKALLSEDASGDESSRNGKGVRYKVTENNHDEPTESGSIELSELNGVEVGHAFTDSAEPSRAPKREVYTVDEAVNQLGFGPFQVLVTFFAGMIWVSTCRD